MNLPRIPERRVPPLSWRVNQQAGVTTVELTGEIDERSDLSELRSRLAGAVVLHLAGVRRINSFGAREWVSFVRDLPQVTDLALSHCSPAVVGQLNMIYGFRGKAQVRSFYAPYLCPRCEREQEKLLHAESDFPTRDFSRVPPLACSCGALMDLDDVVEGYLAFLRQT
jgi:anti-anti-sigma regulatory factor